MKRRMRGSVAALTITLAATAGASALALADTPPPPVDSAVPPPAVEDFNYPGASGITNVKLLRGDGHVLLGDCAKPSQIQIWTRTPGNPDNKVCFTADATGTLSLQLPEVFALQTTDRAIRAGITAGDAGQTVEIPMDGFKAVGEGLGAAPSVVVDLTVTG